ANSFVSKPIDFDQLVRVLGQIGSYWLSLNHSPA
ncbi:MAG: response regulator, partial [Euryarchaeota archaeon]|nr:response regulator [Euryarchaeota archaeon]